MISKHNSVAVGTICFAVSEAIAVYLGANVSVWLCALFFTLTTIMCFFNNKNNLVAVLSVIFMFSFFGCSYFIILDHFCETAVTENFTGTTHNVDFVITEKRESQSFNIYTCTADIKQDGGKTYNVKFNIFSFSKIRADYYDNLNAEISFTSPKNDEIRNYNRSCGIFLDAELKGDYTVTKTDGTFNFQRHILALRDKTKKLIHLHMRPERAYVLSALITGDTYNLPDSIKDTFKDISVYHLLVVSGLHASIIGFIVYSILSLIFGRKSKIAAALSCLFLVLFSIFAGLSPSIVRSTIMSCLFIFADTVRRQHSGMVSLGIAAFVMTVFNPYSALNIGFILSFLSVFGIIFISPKLSSFISFGSIRIKAVRSALCYIYKSFCVTASAAISTLPITVLIFKTLSPYLLISNLILMPMVELIVITGIIGVLIGGIIPGSFLTTALFSSESFVIKLFLNIADKIKTLPMSTLRFDSYSDIAVLFAFCFIIAPAYIYLKVLQRKSEIT